MHHFLIVCKLHESILGLKQAPRAWFHRPSQMLLQLGFCESHADYYLFTYHKLGVHIFILVYVDDLIVIGTHLSLIMNLISYLKEDFSMKDLGPFYYFLGIQVTRGTNLVFIYHNPSIF